MLKTVMARGVPKAGRTNLSTVNANHHSALMNKAAALFTGQISPCSVKMK